MSTIKSDNVAASNAVEDSQAMNRHKFQPQGLMPSRCGYQRNYDGMCGMLESDAIHNVVATDESPQAEVDRLSDELAANHAKMAAKVEADNAADELVERATPRPWTVQRLNHVENELWLQIGFFDAGGREIGPIAELVGGAVKMYRPVAEFQHLVAPDAEVEANAELIVAAVNSYDPRPSRDPILKIVIRDLEEMLSDDFCSDPKLYVAQIVKYLKAASALQASAPAKDAAIEALRLALADAISVIDAMRDENRLHGHITDASSRYLHHVEPAARAALNIYDEIKGGGK